METTHEWKERIRLLTEKMKIDHPELTHYLDDMQKVLLNHGGAPISFTEFQEYFNSLLEFSVIYPKEYH